MKLVNIAHLMKTAETFPQPSHTEIAHVPERHRRAVRLLVLHSSVIGGSCRPLRSAYASFWHFFMKLFLAAPLSGFPSLLTAFGSHESFLHFVTNAVFAAPASAFPSLPTARASQALCANPGVAKSIEIRTAAMIRDICCSCSCPYKFSELCSPSPCLIHSPPDLARQARLRRLLFPVRSNVDPRRSGLARQCPSITSVAAGASGFLIFTQNHSEACHRQRRGKPWSPIKSWAANLSHYPQPSS